jgi:hypothetical protein
MDLRRSKVDWIIETAALAALVAMFVIIATHWSEIPVRPRFRSLPPRAASFGYTSPWNPQTVLWIMMALAAATYMLLTLAGVFQKMINLPAEIHRDSPQVRQLVLSMMIVLKAMVMLLFVYFSWTLIAVVTGHGRGLRPEYLVLFVAAVPLPLILYTVKLRRYRR